VRFWLSLLVSTAWLKKEVSDLFHVDFQKGHSHTELGLIRVLLNEVENVIHTPRNDACFEMQIGLPFVCI